MFLTTTEYHRSVVYKICCLSSILELEYTTRSCVIYVSPIRGLMKSVGVDAINLKKLVRMSKHFPPLGSAGKFGSLLTTKSSLLLVYLLASQEVHQNLRRMRKSRDCQGAK